MATEVIPCKLCLTPFERIVPDKSTGVALYCSEACRKEVIKRQKREAKKRLRERQARLR